MATQEPPRKLDDDIERIHFALLDLVHGEPPDTKAEEAYWTVGATEFQAGFRTFVDEWRKVDPGFPPPGSGVTSPTTAKRSPTSAS
jgi:hypothetical protein